MTGEQGTPENRVRMHNMLPKDGSWIWINRDVVDTPEVHLGDFVAFEASGWKVLGTVSRCDENSITVREEPPEPGPCDTCTIRDQYCCDPWENPQDHEGDA